MLAGLLAIDMGFIGLHSLLNDGDTMPRFLRLDRDGSLGEWVQYAKFAAAAAGCIYLAWRWRQWVMVAWTGMFTALLLDDALKGHERIGDALANGGWVGDLGPIRPDHFGEILGFAILEGSWLLLVLVAWRFAAPAAAKLSLRLMMALVLLVVTGLLVDAMQVGNLLPFKRGVAQLEDGGEMIAASMLVVLLVAAVAREMKQRSPITAKRLATYSAN